MSEREIKVSDRRMFAADGTLREEYRHLESSAAAPTVASPPDPAPPAEPPPPPAAAPAPPPLDLPGTPPGLGPSFVDLLSVLAEPIAIYLGEAPLPDGGSAEDLDLARFYIDLLDVVRRKTAGNLTPQELATLDNVLYQSRMRYVQKRG